MVLLLLLFFLIAPMSSLSCCTVDRVEMQTCTQSKLQMHGTVLL
jgi:hypothetical protein